MKNAKITIILVAATIIAACSTSKKTVAPAEKPVAVAPTINAPKADKPANGIFEPGDAELLAIQSQFKNTTLAQLKEGYAVYTKDACVSCHKPKDIYKRPTASWKGIIEDMAEKAKLSPAAKEAVYKYVLAIKATQPGGQQFNMMH